MSHTSGVIKLQWLSDGKLRQARALRKNQTNAEPILWNVLRKKSILGIKSRRQQIIEGFIADFFCEKAKLVIEVDGEIHQTPEQTEIDSYRREVFEARGLKEILFSNGRVTSDLSGVIEEIRHLAIPRPEE